MPPPPLLLLSAAAASCIELSSAHRGGPPPITTHLAHAADHLPEVLDGGAFGAVAVAAAARGASRLGCAASQLELRQAASQALAPGTQYQGSGMMEGRGLGLLLHLEKEEENTYTCAARHWHGRRYTDLYCVCACMSFTFSPAASPPPSSWLTSRGENRRSQEAGMTCRGTGGAGGGDARKASLKLLPLGSPAVCRADSRLRVPRRQLAPASPETALG